MTIIARPILPDWLPELTIRNLRAGSGTAAIRFRGSEVDVLANSTGFEILHATRPRHEAWAPQGVERATPPAVAPDGSVVPAG